MLSSSKIGMYLKNRNCKNQKLNFTKSSVVVQIFSNPSLPNCINRHYRFFEHGADNTAYRNEKYWRILTDFRQKSVVRIDADSNVATLLPRWTAAVTTSRCSSLGRFSKWSSVAIVALLLEHRRADGFEFANRQFGSRANVHESRHASTVEKGVVHQSVTAHTKNFWGSIQRVWHRGDGEDENGQLSRDVICGPSLAE